jgi:hypothetical protein
MSPLLQLARPAGLEEIDGRREGASDREVEVAMPPYAGRTVVTRRDRR